MIIAVTGHRPDKLGNEYNMDGKYSNFINKEIQKLIDEYKPNKGISGMALGVDTIFAINILYSNIPLIAAIPFEGQESKWIQESKDLYFEILNNPLTEKKYVCEPGYANWKMQRRNEWMVDHCDVLIAVWNGSAGGTCNCIKYAKSQKKEIKYINPELVKVL
jgi:uncharacterized phage-like protein YoqJ